jgi:hypothetical protein
MRTVQFISGSVKSYITHDAGLKSDSPGKVQAPDYKPQLLRFKNAAILPLSPV